MDDLGGTPILGKLHISTFRHIPLWKSAISPEIAGLFGHETLGLSALLPDLRRRVVEHLGDQ